MVSIAVLTIFLMGVVSMQSYFGTQTSDRELRTCLLENAASALAQRRNGSTSTSFSFTCKKSSGTVTIGTNNLPLPSSVSPTHENPGACLQITATATAQNTSASVASSVCDF
jgi:hypothetical protein